MSITLQFIDAEWNLYNVPIAFTDITGPHTAEAVGHLIANKLSPFLGMLTYSRCMYFYDLSIGEECKPFAGVIDGGDIASVKYTAEKLGCVIKDATCICHKINNLIKRILGDYFEEAYLLEWRVFIKRLRKSHPFLEMWIQCCHQYFGKEIVLQTDTPTRWSSTVTMLAKAVSVKEAVERMRIVTRDTDHFVCIQLIIKY